MVSGRPHIPKRSEELTVAAVGGNFSKSSKMTVSGTISLNVETASNSVPEPVSREEGGPEEARIGEKDLKDCLKTMELEGLDPHKKLNLPLLPWRDAEEEEEEEEEEPWWRLFDSSEKT